MTPDERNLLTNFLSDLVSARSGPKDQEAESLIERALGSNPDAAYLLVQHAILADQSLHAAQGRIAELEQQVQQGAPSAPAASSSFFGSGGPGPWGSRPPGSTPAPDQGPTGAFSPGGGLGSFLRTAGTTAAGVVGGEMLFSGLSGLFGGHSGAGFGGGAGLLGQPGENVTVNNYGGSDDDDADSANSDDQSGGDNGDDDDDS